MSLQTTYRPERTIIENLNSFTCSYTIPKQCACNLHNSSGDKDSESLQEKIPEPPDDEGFENWNHWSHGLEKATMDKLEMHRPKYVKQPHGYLLHSAEPWPLWWRLRRTSITLVTTVTVGGGLGLTLESMDLSQFSVMINQFDLQACRRFCEKNSFRHSHFFLLKKSNFLKPEP